MSERRPKEVVGIDMASEKGHGSLRDRLALLRRLPRSVYRHRGLASRVASGLATRNWPKLRNAAKDGYLLLLSRLLEETAADFRDHAKTSVGTLLDEAPWIGEQLVETPHFGALASLCSLPLRRAHYVGRQLEVAYKLQKARAGLGLSSSPASSLKLRGQPISGLELVQLWSVLLSIGQPFGTFASLKALGYEFATQSDLRADFLSCLPESSRVPVDALLRRGTARETAQALAAWRLATQAMPDDLRRLCLEALAMLSGGDDTDRLQRLRAIHLRVRQVAYLQMHGMAGLGLAPDGLSPMEFLPSIAANTADFFEVDGVAFSPALAHETPVARFMQAVDEIQHWSFFTSHAANELVLGHLRAFRQWWKKSHGKARPICLSELFGDGPADWPKLDAPRLRPFLRVELLDREEEWVETVRSWRGRPETWSQSNFVYSARPDGLGGLCDIYTTGLVTKVELRHIASQLASECASSWKHDSEPGFNGSPLWRSISRFALAMLRQILPDSVEPVIIPALAVPPSVGLAMIANGLGVLSSRADVVVGRLRDPQRRTELAAVFRYITQRGTSPDGVWLALLGPLELHPTGESVQVTEIDGVLLRFGDDELEWQFFEVKSGRGTGAKQLNRLRGLLGGRSDPLVHENVPGSTVSVLTVRAEYGCDVRL